MDANDIKEKFKVLGIVFKISAVVRIVNFVCIIIIGILELCNVLERSLIHNYINPALDFVLLLIMSCGKIGITIGIISELKAIVIAPNTGYALQILKTVLWLCSIFPIFLIIAPLMSIAMSIPLGLLAYLVGYSSLGCFSFIIGFLMVIVAYTNIKYADKVNKYGSVEAYNEAMLKEQEEKAKANEQREKELAEQKARDTALHLLEEIGRKFFVKYYEPLQKWSILDMVDVIEENYSEESKLARIKKAKKLFELNLHKTALQIIARDIRHADDDTRNQAATLLQKIDGNNDKQ